MSVGFVIVVIVEIDKISIEIAFGNCLNFGHILLELLQILGDFDEQIIGVAG